MLLALVGVDHRVDDVQRLGLRVLRQWHGEADRIGGVAEREQAGALGIGGQGQSHGNKLLQRRRLVPAAGVVELVKGVLAAR